MGGQGMCADDELLHGVIIARDGDHGYGSSTLTSG